MSARTTSTAPATYLIAYDLADAPASKHALATRLMTLGDAWARPLDQTWYVRATKTCAAAIEAELGDLIGEDDGLIVQAVAEDHVLTNTALRWFRRRSTPLAETDNIVAFPIIAAPTAWTQGRTMTTSAEQDELAKAS